MEELAHGITRAARRNLRVRRIRPNRHVDFDIPPALAPGTAGVSPEEEARAIVADFIETAIAFDRHREFEPPPGHATKLFLAMATIEKSVTSSPR